MLGLVRVGGAYGSSRLCLWTPVRTSRNHCASTQPRNNQYPKHQVYCSSERSTSRVPPQTEGPHPPRHITSKPPEAEHKTPHPAATGNGPHQLPATRGCGQSAIYRSSLVLLDAFNGRYTLIGNCIALMGLWSACTRFNIQRDAE